MAVKKKSKALPRKRKTGLAAAPTDSFQWFRYYIRMELEKKEISDVLRTYIKDNFKGEERTILLSAPDYFYTSEYGPAASVHWKKLGNEWPEKWNGKADIERWIKRTRVAALKKMTVKTSEGPVIPKKSPMEIVKEKTSDFIAEIEDIIDMFNTDVHMDWDNYSVYNEMVKADLNAVSAKKVLDYYKPLQAEMTELVEKKTEDLVEAYSHWKLRERKQFLKIVTSICDDAEKYVMSKKAVRKPSKPRVKTADKQIAKLNYLKDSNEFKLTSINPTLIIGSNRLYTFNTKTRMLTEYVNEKPGGFEVKGSTLVGFDADRSRGIRLRKPEEHLTTFLSKTPAAINKFWGTLTTKTVDNVNGRINKDTIILRVLDK